MGFFSQFGFCCFHKKTCFKTRFQEFKCYHNNDKIEYSIILSLKGKLPGVRKRIRRARKVKQQDGEGLEEKVLQNIKVQMIERRKIAQSLVW